MTDPSLTRRRLLASGIAGGAALAFAGPAAAVPLSRRPVITGGAFRHGVASGIPGERAITLWTRVSELERSGRMTLEIARDADFRSVVDRREVPVVQWRDYTARATVRSRRLAPGEEYFYRFATRGADSPVGRFRTRRPPDSREPVRIGFFSCQKYADGFYTAQAGLAQEDLDLVVCLGDYVYESGGSGVRTDRAIGPDGSRVQTLREYRDKYALYREDPDLQAMHAAHPFVATWDDHELENNYAGDEPSVSSANTPERRVSYEERMRQAYLAFFEWMPRFRIPEDPMRVYRRVRLGALADVLVVDTRQYRDRQPCGDVSAMPCLENDPGRTFLGTAQKAWLKRAFEEAPASAWKVVANQTMMMSLDFPATVPQNPDQWDGYPREREEILRHLVDRGIQDVAVITGDIHAYFAGDVHLSGRQGSPAAATEFVGGSITSGGFEEAFGAATPAAEAGLRANNPHLRYTQFTRRGYAVMECRPDELLVTYRSPSTITQRTATMDTIGRFRVGRGTPSVEVL